MKRHLQSMAAQSSDHLISDKLDLILPRRDFIIGGTIPFELKFTTIVKPWQISLRMNKVYTKMKRNPSKTPNYKYFTDRYPLERTFYESSISGHSFSGILHIPRHIPPTIRSCNTPTKLFGELVYQIEYVLEARLYIEEISTPPIVQVPIDLGFSRKPNNDLQPILENRNLHTKTETSTSVDEGNDVSSRLEGLTLSQNNISGFGIRDQPPRYSMLSLPIVGCSRTNSVETLPPYYEDIRCTGNGNR